MRDLASYLASHHGVITRRQALGFGLTVDRIRGRVRSGDWVRVHSGVYRLATAPDTWHARARAAALAGAGFASHTSALRLWSVDGFDRVAALHITTPRPSAHAFSGVHLHRSPSLVAAETAIVDGVPTTGVTRALIAAAGVLTDSRLDGAVDAVLRQQLGTLSALSDRLDDLGTAGRAGAGRLRRLLAERGPAAAVPDSRFNRLVGRLLVDGDLPEPVYEHSVAVPGAGICRVDLAYPAAGLAIECDSRRWHHNRASFDADPRRRNLLLAAGYRVLSFTWSDYHDRPAHLVTTVRTALTSSAVLPARGSGGCAS